MANRYIVATGNWSNTAVWSATSGGAGGVSVPTTSDQVFLDANFTVSLTANAVAFVLTHTNGRLNINSFTLTLSGGLLSNGATARTLDFGSGVVSVSQLTSFVGGRGFFAGSNLTFIAGTSTLQLNCNTGNIEPFGTLGLTFNDVFVNLGQTGGSGTSTLNITGSPTFRSLVIRSINTAAHSFNLEGSATLTVSRFIVIGSSSSNKLTVQPFNGTATITFTANGTSYGQNAHLSAFATGSAVYYIGSNSTRTSGTGWLLQDPPLMSTLVDLFTGTIVDSARWTTSIGGSAYITQNGTLTLGWFGGSSSFYQLTSKDTFNLASSDLILEINSNFIAGFLSITPTIVVLIDGTSLQLLNNNVVIASATLVKYTRLRYTAGQLRLATSTANGTAFTTATGGVTVDPAEVSSVRFNLSGSRNIQNGDLVIEAINPLLYDSPNFLFFFNGL